MLNLLRIDDLVFDINLKLEVSGEIIVFFIH